MSFAIARSFLITRKKILVISVILINALIFSSQVQAKEFNFLWNSHAGKETKVVCVNYGDDLVNATFTFYDEYGTKFYARRLMGKF